MGLGIGVGGSVRVRVRVGVRGKVRARVTVRVRVKVILGGRLAVNEYYRTTGQDYWTGLLDRNAANMTV